MSQFNIYARKLDTAFKEARSEYNTAFRALQEAQQANRDANAWRPGVSAEEKQVRTARAALKLHDAEATFNEVSARVWDNFKTTRRTIRAELEQEVRAANLANPDAIDSNALELLKSGVLTSDDYAAFMEKYDSNPTMLKLLAHYAAEAAKAAAEDIAKDVAQIHAVAAKAAETAAVLAAFTAQGQEVQGGTVGHLFRDPDLCHAAVDRLRIDIDHGKAVAVLKGQHDAVGLAQAHAHVPARPLHVVEQALRHLHPVGLTVRGLHALGLAVAAGGAGAVLRGKFHARRQTDAQKLAVCGGRRGFKGVADAQVRATGGAGQEDPKDQGDK